MTKEKSLPLAIGLNLVLPGAGYIYMGKWLVGLAACLLILGIYLTTPAMLMVTVWLGMNIMMGIDMMILAGKNKKQVSADTTKKCPKCAETIQKEATLCRYCGTNLTA